jgi:hypothetical protein
LLLCRADTADDDIDLGQNFNELLLRRLQVALADLDSSLLELLNGRLVYGNGADEGVNILHDAKSMHC